VAAHDITSLVKFCDTETGLKILNSQSLRWSSPNLFNDPFELNHNSEPDFTPKDLINGMIKEAISMLFGPTEPTGKSNRLIAAISRWRGEDRFASEDEAAEVLKQLLTQVAQQQQVSIDKFLSAWALFARNSRICCFCEKPANLYAWQRFADNHKGIALRFSCGDDTALPNPQKVSYSTAPPLVTSLKEQIRVCYGRQDPPATEEFLSKLLNKNKNDNVEKEWRCIETENAEQSADADEQLWYTNKKFSAPELKAVYLGLTTSFHDKETVIKLVKQKYQKTKVFQAEALSGRYEIDFSPVGTR
jgi:hypothetical protein